MIGIVWQRHGSTILHGLESSRGLITRKKEQQMTGPQPKPARQNVNKDGQSPCELPRSYADG